MSRAGLKCQEFSPAPRLSSRNAGRSRPTRCGSKSRRIGDWGAGLARRVEVFPPTSSATAPPKPRPPGTTNLTRWASPVPVHHRAISIVARFLARAVRWVQCCYHSRFAPEGKPCQCARGKRVVQELAPPMWPDAPWHSGDRWWSRPPRPRYDADNDKSFDRSPFLSQGTHVSSDNKSLPAGNAASPERRN
jgi:hypothetical protein